MQAHPPLAGGCAQVSPPLPGGYKVGEKVFYTGQSLTFESGDKTHKYVNGERGEVTGPATIDSHKGKGVEVRFSGDSRECYLTHVRRLRTPPPLPPRLRPTLATLPTPGAPTLLRPPLPCCPNPCCKRSRARAVAQRL